MSDETKVGAMGGEAAVDAPPAVDLPVEVPETEPQAPPTPPPTPPLDAPEVTPEPDDELWPGGPKFSQIEAWKQAHGDIYVTSLTPDTHYVWRTLTRFEYRRLVKNLEQSISTGQVTQAEANMNNEEQITEIALLYPLVTRPEMADKLAGLASIISQEVLESSGFQALEVRQL